MSTTPSTTTRQDQQDGAERPIDEEASDRAVLRLMLCNDSGFPWSVEEIVRTIGEPLDAVDTLRRLEAAGLAHRLGDFVFPTLAARRADELSGGSI
jgi:ABC-type hemin transport system ATPase subunit